MIPRDHLVELLKRGEGEGEGWTWFDRVECETRWSSGCAV